MAADGSTEATTGRWRGRLLVGLTAGVLLVPISASAAGAAGTGKATYAAKVSGLCRAYATTFAQAGAKVGSGSPSGARTAAALSKAVSKAQIELQKITSVPKPKAQAAALRQTFANAKKLLAQLGALAAPVKAHNEQQVAAKLAAIERTEAALAKKFGSVGLASCATGTAASTSSGTEPVLDASVLDSPVGGTSGYGQVKPAGIAISGTGGTNEVINIVWSSWGGATATGAGTGCVLQSTGIEANCARTPADVVVYELGSCSGKPAYLAMTWYFPSLGQSFTPSTASPTPIGSACHTTASGGSSSSSTTAPPPTTTHAAGDDADHLVLGTVHGDSDHDGGEGRQPRLLLPVRLRLHRGLRLRGRHGHRHTDRQADRHSHRGPHGRERCMAGRLPVGLHTEPHPGGDLPAGLRVELTRHPADRSSGRPTTSREVMGG